MRAMLECKNNGVVQSNFCKAKANLRTADVHRAGYPDRVKGTVMKIDRALTMEECLDKWCVVPMRVDPPACDARHIPIAEEKNVYSGGNARSCNCDRWGHRVQAVASAERNRGWRLPCRYLPNN
jgi:hypothetical protein